MCSETNDAFRKIRICAQIIWAFKLSSIGHFAQYETLLSVFRQPEHWKIARRVPNSFRNVIWLDWYKTQMRWINRCDNQCLASNQTAGPDCGNLHARQEIQFQCKHSFCFTTKLHNQDQWISSILPRQASTQIVSKQEETNYKALLADLKLGKCSIRN